MELRERVLVVLLRCGAVLLGTAFLTIFLPVDWMAATHRRLGLGDFPASTLVDYLTRSASALYALHGGVLAVASLDVRRFAPLVVYLGGSNVVLGLLLLGIDLHAGLPGWWVFMEGPWVAALGVALLWLVWPLRGGWRERPTTG